MDERLVNWYQHRHHNAVLTHNNLPTVDESLAQLKKLHSEIIQPLESAFGNVQITYGFTSFELLKYIKKHSPKHIAPELDQHAAHELNSKGNRICKRDGAAFDFYIDGYENQMQVIASYIINCLSFDRLYFYGNNRPLHVSISSKNNHFVQMMATTDLGRRYPAQRCYGKDALKFFL